MAKLASKPEMTELTEQEIHDRIALWREHLIEANTGNTNCVLTRAEIIVALDALLDELLVFILTREPDSPGALPMPRT